MYPTSQISDSEKEQSVRKEDFNDIVEEVRNLKDQVVSLKLQMWQLNQEKLTTDLDRDIALDSSSNYVVSVYISMCRICNMYSLLLNNYVLYFHTYTCD